MATVDNTRETLESTASVLDRLATLFDLIAESAGRTPGCQNIEALAMAGEALARSTADDAFCTGRMALRTKGDANV